MALVRNIAGIQIGALPAGQSPVSTNETVKGLFTGIVKLVGPAAAATPLGAAFAVAAAVEAGIDLLPPGGLKRFLKELTGLAGFIKMAIRLIKGRTYTTGQYRLAERYIDQVISSAGPDTVKSYRDVPDNVVPEAILFFTVVFGVRITTDEDLWALDNGAGAYMARPGVDNKGMADIPDAALQRAVFLKQNFYSAATYNTLTWDLDHFSEYPLIAPIPHPYEFGQFYTGPLPGGGQATEGVILVDEKTAIAFVAPKPATTAGKDNSALWIAGGILAAVGYWYYQKQKR